LLGYDLIGNKIMNPPVSDPHKRQTGKNLGLASVKESAEASSDGGPGKVGFVGDTTASGKIHAIGSIRKDSNQDGIKIIRLVG
jgi:hypothetical protein